ncbi:Beta-galactosidase C-terminal domain, partial [Paenibacillus sepulcri]|nr:Beta-galactosidase C-terminal domain [Paenibacillus sepulcri]
RCFQTNRIILGGVEVASRDKDGHSYLFVMNHNPNAVTVEFDQNYGVDLLTGQPASGPATVAGRGVMIIEASSLPHID